MVKLERVVFNAELYNTFFLLEMRRNVHDTLTKRGIQNLMFYSHRCIIRSPH